MRSCPGWDLEPTYAGLLQAIELMSCGLVVANADGIIHYANPRILEWTGYRAKELDGKPATMIAPPEIHDDYVAERQRAIDGDLRTRLGAIRRKDGRTFPVAVAPQPFTRLDNGEVAMLSILIDLGEIHTGRPVGAPENSLAADLASVALKLQSMSFSASVASEGTFPVDHPLLRELSAREREVLETLVKGARVPAIAKQLFISQNTVRNHLKAIYRKVDVSSQSELIELVRSLGAS